MTTAQDLMDDASKTSGPAASGNNYLGRSPAPWTGPGGQGYYDTRTGQSYNYQDAPAGTDRLDRAGIDARLQGNLENPYSGYLFGKPGAAEADESRLQGLAAAARNAPGAQIDNAQYNADRGLEMGARGNQDYALQQYRDLIEGRGTSVAQQQMNQGLSRSMAQQASIAASARGGGANLVAAQQAASNAAGNLSGQVAGQSALLRAQEVQGALAGYGGLATQQRAADLQRQGLSAEQAYRQAQLEQSQHAINAQTGLGYEGLRQSEAGMQQQGMEYNESENQNAYMGGLGIGVQQNAQNQAQQNAYVQGGTQLGASVLGLIGASYSDGGKNNNGGISSDIRKKKDIGDGRGAVSEQLAAMSPQTYQYKDASAPGAGPGQRVGVMAQDMERGPYGGQLVKDTPQGKKIDGPGGLSLALAGTANHEQRLRALEGGGGPKMPYRDMSKLTPAEWAEYTMAQNARQHGIATPADEAYVQRARGAVPQVVPQAQGLAAAPQVVPGIEPPPQAPEQPSYGYGDVARNYLMGGVPGMLSGAYAARRGR